MNLKLRSGKQETDLLASVAQVDINDAKPRRWGLLVLLLGFGGFMLWAALAPLDQGVGAPGQVIVSGNRKMVQNLNGGLVQSIRVKDGDEVAAGQVLLELDATPVRAALDSSRGQWFVSKAAEARLTAERDARADVAFPPELLKETDDPRAVNALLVQSQLARTRRAALQADVGAIRESIAGLESYITGLEATKASKDEQIKLIREEIKGQRELAAEGFLARNRLLEQERTLAQLSGALSEDLGNLGRARQSVAELKMRILSRRQEYQKEVETQLAEVQKEVAALDSRIRSLTFDLENTAVRSPADGIVVGLNIHTVGGVLGAASHIMDVVPMNEPLTIDAQIPTALIDRVRPGLEVEILFPAFNQRTTPQIPGTMSTVSADALTDPQNRITYYKAQVQVTPAGMKMLKDHEIKAGMPAEIFIKTGERTMMNYLFKPLVDRFRTSLTEQ